MRALKCIISAILAGALINCYISSIAQTAYKEETVYKAGDVNGDGAVNAADALLVLQCAVGKADFDFPQKKAADVNRNGVVEAADALLILQHTVGKITHFPCGRLLRRGFTMSLIRLME